MSTTIGPASAKFRRMAAFLWLWSTSRTEGYRRKAGNPGGNHPSPPAGRGRMFTRKQPARDWQHSTVYVPCSNQGACSASTWEQRSIVFALCNQLQRDCIGPDFDRRAVVQNHTREMPAPRFRPCDITQCELEPPSVDCQPGGVLGTSSSTHQTIVSPCLDTRRQCHRRASAVPSCGWECVGQGRRSTRKLRGQARSVAIVAAERSDAHREQTCFAASHLFYRKVVGARSS